MLAREDVPEEVSKAYGGKKFSFGPDYIIPSPLDPRIIEWVTPAVARAAMESGVARARIEDLDAYRAGLRERVARMRPSRRRRPSGQRLKQRTIPLFRTYGEAGASPFFMAGTVRHPGHGPA